jgi:plasmid stabilization system protein ParE
VQVARDWYERQRAGLGDAFTDAVDDFLVRIGAMPELYGVVLRDVRRGKLRRFPYLVYYRVLSDRIEVIAVLHSGRHPRVWQSRA